MTEVAPTLFVRFAKATVAPLRKLVPVMLVLVPPASGPDVTLRLVIVGAALPIAKMHAPVALLMLVSRYSEKLRL